MGSKGLARFRSAPATWLDALLDPSDSDDVFKLPNQPLLDIFDTPDLFTQNSSPTGPGSDTSYFSSYQGGGAGYEFTPSPNSSGSTSSSSKRPRQDTFSSTLKEEDQSEHLERGLSGLMDPDMEKLLEASVPCRVRAKRGCATHPRSIAERVRRTRISDRIRKLQELVPNMEKQVNTSDMLEEAVEYVKLLQRQIQELTEQQKNCTCMPKE